MPDQAPLPYLEWKIEQTASCPVCKGTMDRAAMVAGEPRIVCGKCGHRAKFEDVFDYTGKPWFYPTFNLAAEKPRCPSVQVRYRQSDKLDSYSIAAQMKIAGLSGLDAMAFLFYVREAEKRGRDDWLKNQCDQPAEAYYFKYVRPVLDEWVLVVDERGSPEGQKG